MDWDKMTPRERDALVAEHIFGWRKIQGPKTDYDGPCDGVDILIPPSMTDAKAFRMLPPRGAILSHYFTHYWSIDLFTAWEVVEKFPLFRVERVEIYVGHAHTKATCWTDVEEDPVCVECPTAPEAICLAALRAVGVEV